MLSYSLSDLILSLSFNIVCNSSRLGKRLVSSTVNSLSLFINATKALASDILSLATVTNDLIIVANGLKVLLQVSPLISVTPYFPSNCVSSTLLNLYTSVCIISKSI